MIEPESYDEVSAEVDNLAKAFAGPDLPVVRYQFSFTAAPGPGSAPMPQRRQPGRNGAPDSPIRADFPGGRQGAAEYVHAWHIWQQQMADGLPTRAERAVRAALYADLFGVPYDVAEFSTLGQLRILDQMAPDDRALVVAALHREEAS